MGFFNRKKKNEAPKLPKLPEASGIPTPQTYPQAAPQTYPQAAPQTYPQAAPQESQPSSAQEQTNFPLPTYPSSNLGNTINQNTIKEEITGNNERPMPAIPTPPPVNQMPQMPPLNPTQAPEIKQIRSSQKSRVRETRAPKTLEMPARKPPKEYREEPVVRIKKRDPLFIQLDKFEETISAFDEIKLKVSEIESLLKSVREEKRREEERLNHWEDQIDQIKTQLGKIDQELFSKL